MKKICLVLLLPFFLLGCAATQETIIKDSAKESQVLQPAAVKLAKFKTAQLKPLAIADAISSNPDKLRCAQELDAKLTHLIQPLVADWPSTAQEGKTIIIQPKITHLRIISKGTRFLAGLMAGQSSVSLDLQLIDGESGEAIANTTITKVALGNGGPGVADDNILDYVANISHQYLLANM